MRREQVLKICLNHILTSDIDYRAKDDKTWLFSAPDFSEGEIVQQQFCLRFKNAEITQDFKKAVTNALGKSVTVKNGKVDVNSILLIGTGFAFLYVGFLIIYTKSKRL